MANFQFPSASMAQNSTPNLPEGVPGWGETHKPCSPPGWQCPWGWQSPAAPARTPEPQGSSPSCCWLSSPGEAGAERCPSHTELHKSTNHPIWGSFSRTGLSHHLHSHLHCTAPAGRSTASPGAAGGEEPLRCSTSHPRCSCSCHHSSSNPHHCHQCHHCHQRVLARAHRH